MLPQKERLNHPALLHMCRRIHVDKGGLVRCRRFPAGAELGEPSAGAFLCCGVSSLGHI